jgi:hypothetical protein
MFRNRSNEVTEFTGINSDSPIVSNTSNVSRPMSMFKYLTSQSVLTYVVFIFAILVFATVVYNIILRTNKNPTNNSNNTPTNTPNSNPSV